jgi:hypothetical protein
MMVLLSLAASDMDNQVALLSTVHIYGTILILQHMEYIALSISRTDSTV